MPSQKKIQIVKEIGSLIEEYPVVGILNMHKLPGRQLHFIKEKMKGKAKIKMLKKKLLERVMKEAKKSGIRDLESYFREQPALLFSKSNPFELARLISAAKSKAPAKAGDIAPTDITIPAGPTPLAAGPAIGELQKVGLTVGVEAGKVAVKKDSVIVKQGQIIRKEVADVLSKLSIEPMEIGLDLLAVWDNGTIYDKAVLFIPQEKYLDDLKAGFVYGLNLSVKINYYTKDNIKVFLSKSHMEGLSLAIKAGYITKEALPHILAKAQAEAAAVQKHIKA